MRVAATLYVIHKAGYPCAPTDDFDAGWGGGEWWWQESQYFYIDQVFFRHYFSYVYLLFFRYIFAVFFSRS